MLPIEAEILAVVLACRKFHQYIYGRSTVVETDHKSLQAKAQNPCHKFHWDFRRWSSTCVGYDVEVRYIPWNKQIVADTLSRAAVPSAEKEG